MNFFKGFPVTCCLIIINMLAFLAAYFDAGSLSGEEFTLTLLHLGADFNPYTLGGEWYRIFTAMFLHGSVLHLVVNMYGLFSVGGELEPIVGSWKFLVVYIVSGVASSLASLYWGLFTVSVGASGAIFGVFGFLLVMNISDARREGVSMTPVIFNFVLFTAVNLYFTTVFRVDIAGHIGGLVMGCLLGIVTTVRHTSLRKISVEYAAVPLLILIYWILPRYQVTYFNFFQKVLSVERSFDSLFARKDLSDAEFVKMLRIKNAGWDSARAMLERQKTIPEALHNDVFRLSHYIRLQKMRNDFHAAMIERESFVYLDSIGLTRDSLKRYTPLDYPLNMDTSTEKEELKKEKDQKIVKVWYDKDWEEIDGPGMYYRIGTKDSLGNWDGLVNDFYADGEIQMRGSYNHGKRDGIFLYYSDHHTYTSAGRYQDDKRIGKWELFFNNGQLESEVYFRDRYFLKNLWDSTGHPLVRDGYGKVTTYYSNGVVKESGSYENGYKEGYWFGKFENGEMFFEENFFKGHLVRGRSQNLQHKKFIYDQSSLYPLPEGGYRALNNYLSDATKKSLAADSGIVRLVFRVTTIGRIVDVVVEKSVSPQCDSIAKELLRNGPAWTPSMEHGQIPFDSHTFVDVEFKKQL